MSGKCRPSLRKKTLENVKRSKLSKTDKDCIAEVFARYERIVEKPPQIELFSLEKSEFIEDDYPCNNCDQTCDHWDARFCCTLCHYNGLEDCDNCDPRDI